MLTSVLARVERSLFFIFSKSRFSPVKQLPLSGLIPSNQWADDKMTQLCVCRSINKTFDLLHLLREWCRSGKSPFINPQSLCSSALMWIYRFVWLFHSTAWVSKFPQMEIYNMSSWFGDITTAKVRQTGASHIQKPPLSSGARLLIRQKCPNTTLCKCSLWPRGREVVARQAKSRFSTFPTHIFPAGARTDANNIPGRSMCFCFSWRP